MLWKMRNGAAHGKTSGQQGLVSASQGAKMAMAALRKKAPHLLEADQCCFDAQTPEERLQAPTRVIKGWVTTVKPVVSTGPWQASEHNWLHNWDL
jgi:hypothetical protein